MIDDEALDALLAREADLANEETARLMRHWEKRNANPLILMPILITALLKLLRRNVEKEIYDNTVMMVLAEVEQAEQNFETTNTDEGKRNEPRRVVH